jgi:hypothetical protein
MKTKNKIKWYKPANWGIVKVYRDFENYADWVRTVKREESDINSKFNKYKLSHNKVYDVYITVTLDENDAMLSEVVKRTKVLEELNPIHRYLDDDLGFAECINCEFNQFEDDNGKPTLTYLIVYRFRFEKFSLKWIGKSLVMLGILSYIIIHFNLVSKFLALIK